MDKKPIEERLYERLNLPIKVNYEVSTRPHQVRGTISKNISGGGICLSLTEKLIPDTTLIINISTPKPRREDYRIKGKIVWTRRIEVSGGRNSSAYYDTGIQFLEADPIIIGKIVAYFHGREL